MNRNEAREKAQAIVDVLNTVGDTIWLHDDDDGERVSLCKGSSIKVGDYRFKLNGWVSDNTLTLEKPNDKERIEELEAEVARLEKEKLSRDEVLVNIPSGYLFMRNR